MAVIAITPPTLAPVQNQTVVSESQPFSVFAGNTVNDGGLVIVDGTNAGYVKEMTLLAGTSPYNIGGATLCGLALHNSNAVFAPPATGATRFNTPFGVYSNTNTALQPLDATTLKVALFHNGNQFSFSLDPAISLTQSLIHTTIGLASTGSSNGDLMYVTTTGTGTCLCATIVRIVQGPGYGVIGTDTGGRVIVQFSPTFLAI